MLVWLWIWAGLVTGECEVLLGSLQAQPRLLWSSLQSPPSSHPGDTDREDDESLDDHDNTPAPGLPPANIGTIFQSLLIKIIWKVSLQRTADCRQTKLYRSISGQTDNEEEIEMLISWDQSDHLSRVIEKHQIANTLSTSVLF